MCNNESDQSQNTPIHISSDEFLDLFDVDELQRLQDLFATANGVASVITHTDGTPITKPSNFCRLCSELIRGTEKGRANCFTSDAMLGRHHPSGPVVQPCLSVGLYDAGVSITVGGHHVANWLIGQVRNEDLDSDRMLDYADEIGVDRSEFLAALQEVPEMPREKFEQVSSMLFAFANSISEKAYNMFLLKQQVEERDQAQERLVESERKFRTIYETTVQGICIVDTEQIITSANPQFGEMLGYAVEELEGKDFASIFPSEDLDIMGERMQQRSRGESGKYEQRLLRKDETMMWAAVSGTPMLDGDGRYTGSFGLFSDITEQKRTEQELRLAKEQAERSERLKDAFIANISHEIRTPLNSIAGFSMLIEEASTIYLNEEQQSYFEHIQFGVQRLLRTVDLILILSRLQSGDLEPKIDPLDLPSRLSYLCEGFKFQVEQRKLDLILKNDVGPLIVHTDEYCLTEAVSNLINNAIKFTEEGSVTLRLRREETDRILLDIADTGVGISDEYKPLLFNPYTQEDIGYSRSYEGIGLGLSLVKKYLDLLELQISFESEKGKGTTFTIDLTKTIQAVK